MLKVWLVSSRCSPHNERKEIKKELLNKKKSEFDDLRSSQPFQIANNAKIRIFTQESMLWREV